MTGKNPQYGFAHRVNDWDVIVDALDAGSGGGNVAGNGIEFDIGWSTFYDDWIVSHDSFDLAQPASEYLYEWLGELGKRLATGKYDNSFAALWVDIKTANAADSVSAKLKSRASLQRVVDLVRKSIPSGVSIIYDLGGKENFGLGGGSTTGYDTIRNQLRPNEGIGAWAQGGEEKWVREFYQKFKQDQIVRTVMHHGHSISIDEDVLIEINNPIFHATTDPYRFKKVFTWTTTHSSTMAQYIDPSNQYHTDGQIVGRWGIEWYAGYSDLQDFDNAIAKFSETQRKAVRTDDFWGRSGSDVVPSGTPVPGTNMQPGWRWCRKCQGMFFAVTSAGVCPTGGGHDASQSGAYRLSNNNPPIADWQDGWRWCRRCQGLFRPLPFSACPAPGGGAHDPSQSGNYSLPRNIVPPHTQNHWRQCEKCAGLFFGDHAGSVCPFDHKAHDSGFAFISDYSISLP